MSNNLRNPEEYSMDKGYMSIHEILAANGINQRMLADELDREEALDSETVDDVKADIESNKQRTQIAKEKFILDMKGSLGKDMMKDPTRVTIIKKPWYVRFKNFLKKLFTRF